MLETVFKFPEKVVFRAAQVTSPQFHIQNKKDWMEKLWVDLGPVRGKNVFQQMRKDLGMEGEKLFHSPVNYMKMIVSGHRGCGKSVELKRFHDKINHSDAFFSILLDLEEEANIEQFQAEDLYIALIARLARVVEEHNLKADFKELENTLDEWISETEVKKEITRDLKVEAGAGVKLGWSLMSFLGIEGNFKGVFSRGNKTTQTIRRKIKTNPQELISGLNGFLFTLREDVIKKRLGKELIFVVDGLEKARKEVYDSLFLHDPQFIQGINTHIIFTVPISTHYDIGAQDARDAFITYYLPMIRVTESSIPLLKSIVLRRVDQELIEDEVLYKLIAASGGCPRILLKLVNRSLREADTGMVTTENAETAIHEEGLERFRTLQSEHIEALESNSYDRADQVILELLRSLNLLEYNGTQMERKVNPLLLPHLSIPASAGFD